MEENLYAQIRASIMSAPQIALDTYAREISRSLELLTDDEAQTLYELVAQRRREIAERRRRQNIVHGRAGSLGELTTYQIPAIRARAVARGMML